MKIGTGIPQVPPVQGNGNITAKQVFEDIQESESFGYQLAGDKTTKNPHDDTSSKLPASQDQFGHPAYTIVVQSQAQADSKQANTYQEPVFTAQQVPLKSQTLEGEHSHGDPADGIRQLVSARQLAPSVAEQVQAAVVLEGQAKVEPDGSELEAMYGGANQKPAGAEGQSQAGHPYGNPEFMTATLSALGPVVAKIVEKPVTTDQNPKVDALQPGSKGQHGMVANPLYMDKLQQEMSIRTAIDGWSGPARQQTVPTAATKVQSSMAETDIPDTGNMRTWPNMAVRAGWEKTGGFSQVPFIPTVSVSGFGERIMNIANRLSMAGETLIGRMYQNVASERPSRVFELQLVPKNLGVVEVKLVNQGGTLSIHIQSQTTQAEQLLRQEMASIKETLLKAGIVFDDINLTTNPQLAPEPPKNGQPRFEDFQGYQQPWHGESDERSGEKHEQFVSASSDGIHPVSEPSKDEEDGRQNSRTGIYL